MGFLVGRFAVLPARSLFATSVVRRPARGLSLIELNLVVATIAVIALMIVPARAPVNVAQVDGSLNDVAQTLRFTRDIAARTDTPHGVEIGTEGQRLRVFRVDSTTGNPIAEFDVYNPLEKSLYELALPPEAQAAFSWNGRSGGDPVSSVFNDGQSACLSQRRFVVESDGTTRCFNPFGGRLEGVEVRVGGSAYTRTVRLDPFTSTVSVD